jgi:hypothetical protein
VVTYWGPYFEFWSVMKSAIDAAVTPEEWINPFSFWLFFATMHPIVGGAGDVLGELAWRLPGYSDALRMDEVGPPLAFTATLVTFTKVALDSAILKRVLLFSAAAAMSLSIGGGLNGNDRSSYDLELGRGSPTFAQVRQPSMDNFEISKYGGVWYEQAYHDWTQFAEVYDTI